MSLLHRPQTDRAIREHWGQREFFDTLIVRDVPLALPSIAAAIHALKVAERHRCQTIVIDKGSRRDEFSISSIHAACKRYLLPNPPDMGDAWPEQREARKQNWPVSAPTTERADSLPKGVSNG